MIVAGGSSKALRRLNVLKRRIDTRTAADFLQKYKKGVRRVLCVCGNVDGECVR